MQARAELPTNPYFSAQRTENSSGWSSVLGGYGRPGVRRQWVREAETRGGEARVGPLGQPEQGREGQSDKCGPRGRTDWAGSDVPGPLPRNWAISGGFWGAGARPRGEAGLRRTPRLGGRLHRAACEPMGGGADRGAGGRSREPSGAKGPSAWQPPTPPPRAALPGEERTSPAHPTVRGGQAHPGVRNGRVRRG